MLLLLAGFMFPGLVFTGTVADQVSEPAPTGSEAPVASGTKTEEIGRLQQDLAASLAEINVINEQNDALHSRMNALKSRIRELKKMVLDENPPGDNPDTR